MFDDMRIDMKSNKKLSSIVTELFLYHNPISKYLKL